MAKKLLPTLGTVETSFPDRTFEKTTGCWNCKGWSQEMAKQHWSDKRQKDLEAGLAISLVSPMGENDIKVKNIRQMVDAIDNGVAAGALGICLGGGVDKAGNPVGDFVVHNYHCEKWTGKQGASVARAGAPIDILPAELEDKLS